MIDFFKKIYHFIKPYLIAVGIFFTATLLLKLVETFLFFSREGVSFFQAFPPHLLSNIIVCSFFCIGIFIIYAIIASFSKKGAVATTAALLCIIFLTEVGLTVYSLFTGTLMDSEILIRPLRESLFTIHSIINLGILIPIVLITTGLCVWLALYLNKKEIPDAINLSILGIVLITSPFIGYTPRLMHNNFKPVVNNYITNKCWYCIQSCYDYLQQKREWKGETLDETISTNIKLLQQFVNDHNDWNVEDIKYPLERQNNIQDVLSSYFKFNTQKPNIVFIIVESLGREWNEGVCFAPFIDSLSRNSLYWPNCLSTTSRSFGAVPALTASVPCGRKGFQFGNMPDHNSLYTILKENGYKTNNFYGGDFAFDCVLNYLSAQNCDYLSPFYNDYINKGNPQDGSWWGLHDHVMFDHSIEYLSQANPKQPRMDVFITISSHEGLDLADKKLEKRYTSQAAKTLKQADASVKRQWQNQLSRAASIAYTDNCVKEFIKRYLALPGGKNTIFVITGDHASGLVVNNFLSNHRAPLIIWSPMLTQFQTFPALVTHNDVTPSLIALLSSQGFITAPNYVSWVGNELDNSPEFNSQSRMLIIDYSHEIVDMVYDKYLYHSKTRYADETVFEINDGITLTELHNEKLQKDLAQKMALYKYVNAYTYEQNKLTRHTSNKEQFTEIFEYQSTNSIKCINPKYEPSKLKNIYYNLMNQRAIPEQWQKIRVNVQADVQIMDSLWQNQQKNFIITCNGDNMYYPTTYQDKINKFLTTENVEKGQWYSLNVTKDFIVKDANNLKVKVAISTPEKDEYWLPNCEMNVRNVKVKVLGLK